MYDKAINFIQIVDDQKLTPFRQKCIDSVKDKVRPQDKYEIIEVKYVPDKKEMIRIVDTIKLTKASQIGNACIIDTDCFVSKPIYATEIEEGVPYLGRYTFNETLKMPDIYYMFINNCPEYFAKYLSVSNLNPNGYSITLDTLKGLNGFGYIEDMSYVHFYASMSQVVADQKWVDMSVAYKKAVMELEIYQKSIDLLMNAVKPFVMLRGK